MIALLGSILVFPFLRADEPPKKDDKPTAKPERKALSNKADQLQNLAEELKLTDEQKEKIRPIVREQARKVRELRKDTELSRPDRLAKFKEVREGTLEKLKPILTAEQLEKWKQRRSEGPRKPKEE
jgi:periplasmic protein CpxP/Spy